MFEIIPNWHPIFVHFTVALVASSAFFFVVGAILKNQDQSDALKSAGHWTLRLGAVATVFTLAAGLQAYGTVDHDAPSHAAMTDHRNWAFVAVGFIWVSAIWSVWKSKNTDKTGPVFFTLLGVATILVGLTAYKGGELVYRYGLGVQSLPQPQGGGHAHGEDVMDNHGSGEAVPDESDEGQAHSPSDAHD